MTTTSRNGFTLVELVVVILVMGIMAVSVYPRFMSADSETARSQRDMLLALSHLVQLQSMQDTVNSSTRCPTIVLSAAQAGIATANACLASASFSADANDPNQIQFSSGVGLAVSGATLPVLLRFDSWGRPAGACSSGCTFTLTQSSATFKVCLHASGFIQSC
jgi:MSHA pilin protein MshC